MDAGITFSRFIYPDTNILGIIAQDLKTWRPLQDYLHANDLCLVLSGGQASELSDAEGLHENLNALLSAVPTVIARTMDEVLDEEVARYPSVRHVNIVGGFANEFFLTNRVGQFLGSPELASAREAQRQTAEQMAGRLDQLKSNFPPREDGTYGEEQADEFIWAYVVQWLGQRHQGFLAQFREDVSTLSSEPFRSVSVLGAALFYKYYLHGKPVSRSDFGDLFHLYLLPYCELAVMERDMCNVLNHVKRNHPILDNTVVRNVEFLSDWSF